MSELHFLQRIVQSIEHSWKRAETGKKFLFSLPEKSEIVGLEYK